MGPGVGVMGHMAMTDQSRAGWIRKAAAVLALLALAACGGGKEVAPLELQVLQAGKARFQQLTGGKPAPLPQLSRAFLDTVDQPYIEATLERRDQTAYLLIADRRRDDLPGEIVTWRTGDNVTLTTRAGVLIATRGLGGNLLSAQVQVADGRLGPASGGAHVMQIRAHDNKALGMALACDLEDLGAETIIIVERAHATRHLRQRCERVRQGDEPGQGGVVVNDYWIDSTQGVIWQSRQWAGPEIGYLRLRRLTK